MQINALGNLPFKGVTPIIANNKSTINAVEKLIDSQSDEYGDALIENMTPVYQTWNDGSKMGKAAKNGKQVAFLITGEDYVKYCTGASGYKTIASLTNHIDRDPVVFKD